MVSAFLRMCPQLPSVGECFIEILRYYGQEFNSEKMMIMQGDYVMLMPVRICAGVGMGRWPGLITTDPFRLGVNAAASVTRFTELQRCFMKTWAKVTMMKDRYDNGAVLDEIIGSKVTANF